MRLLRRASDSIAHPVTTAVSPQALSVPSDAAPNPRLRFHFANRNGNHNPISVRAFVVAKAVDLLTPLSLVGIAQWNQKGDPGVVFAPDISLANRLGTRCLPFRFLTRARLADLDGRHTVPKRKAISRQSHEIVTKDAVAHGMFSEGVGFGLEGGDASALDFGNVDRHFLD